MDDQGQQGGGGQPQWTPPSPAGGAIGGTDAPTQPTQPADQTPPAPQPGPGQTGGEEQPGGTGTPQPTGDQSGPASPGQGGPVGS